MNLCGWTGHNGSNQHQNLSHTLQPKTGDNKMKVSMRGSHNNTIYINRRSPPHHPSYSHATASSFNTRVHTQHFHNPECQKSIIDHLDIEESESNSSFRFDYSRKNNSSWRKAHRRIETNQSELQVRSRDEPPAHWKNLIEQNAKLKNIIEKEYEPLKQQYQKLREEQDDRDFLLAQLEWKVKQLAKELQSRKNNH